ncbi:uncharacterized protein ASPGLDRAFT_42974 [Aspergillus glaucus CBS 516.65]|uniref:Uncharacterized protein n=1 Tax=Aspergillus glaucus CBS 516.65 TaxID=1160497 RepID=A0A1L9VVG8_ASPGL|nr:hypothetical protein ASPGLDRAFT_42974 [Aspergillus glaucus CBS 516.65]OJJ87908.1 hypothetical protein ASPGLDRAFT_42974 [Aspergillus glaucus CBS 516.65]
MKLRGIALHSSNAGEFHEIEFLKQHTIYTILLISFMGPRHARMPQAHYDGSNVIIYKTELYDFTKDRSVKALTLFSRWAASSGVGDTRPKKTQLESRSLTVQWSLRATKLQCNLYSFWRLV